MGFVNPLQALDFATYLQRAYNNHPNLAEAYRSMTGSVLYESSATAAFLPTINYTLGEQYSQNNPKEATNHFDTFPVANYVDPSSKSRSWQSKVNLSYNIFNNFKDVEQFNRTILNSKQAYYTFLASENRFIFQTINAYLELMKAESVIKHRQISYDSLNENFTIVSRKFDIEDASISDLEQSRARLALAEADLTTAKLQYDSALAEFVNYYGADNFDKLEELKVEGNFEPNVDSLVKQTYQNDYLRLASYYTLQGSKSEYKKAMLEFGPTIDASISADDTRQVSKQRGSEPENGSRSTTKTAQVSLTLPLYSPGYTPQLRQKAEAVRKDEQTLLKTERDNERDIKKAYINYKNAVSQIQAYEIAVQSAQIAVEAIRKQQRLGLKLVTDVLEAEKELVNTQVYLEQARIDKIKFHYEILARTATLDSSLFGVTNNYKLLVNETLENSSWQNLPSFITLLFKGLN